MACGSPTVDAEGNYSFEVTFGKDYYGIANITIHAKKDGYEEGETSCVVSRMYADRAKAISGYNKTNSYHEVPTGYAFAKVMENPTDGGFYRYPGLDFRVWIPGMLQQTQITEEQVDRSWIDFFTDESEDCAIVIQLNYLDFEFQDAKSKVFEYYERQIGAIAAKAKQAAVQRDFEEAVFILAEVPEECPSFNTQILPLIQQYYEREKDLFGEKVLAEARAAWAAEPNERGAAKVAEIMANMPPSCSSSAAARQFVNQISNKIEAIEKWERNYQEREQAFRHDERKATISAARAVAVAYASNQPKYITKVYLW